MNETRPLNCRFRLQEEGKAYPKSGCQACGKTVMTGLGNKCSVIDLDQEFISSIVEKMKVSCWANNYTYEQVQKDILHFVEYGEGINDARFNTFLSIIIFWLRRDEGTFREQHTLDQVRILAQEMQDKLCGTSLKSSIASLPGK